MERISVYLVDPVGGHAGMHYYDLSLCHNLLKENIDPIYITCDETEKLEEFKDIKTLLLFKNIYGKKHKLFRGLNYLRAHWNIVKIMGKSNVKLVHYHFFELPLFDYLFLKKLKSFKKKIVITAHDVEPFEKGKIAAWGIKKIYRSADKIIVHAASNKKEITEVCGIDEDKVNIIPHGNYDLFVEQKEIDVNEARGKLGLNSFQKIILFFGQIKRVKGLDYLLKAFKEVLRVFPHSVLVIAGAARKNDFNYYEMLIDSLKIRDNIVNRIEYIPDDEVSYYFRAADLIVLPYLKIYQSGVLHLSYTYGKPVVASRLGGIEEVVDDGKTGLLVSPGDVTDLARAIKKVLSNDDMARNMGELGRALIKRKYSWENIAKMTKEVYRSIID